MAHSISARKRVRQNAKSRARNKTRVTALKSKLKKNIPAIGGSDAKAAAAALNDVASAIDKAASRGTLHPNAAARRKSKLARKLNAAKKAPAK